MYCHFKISNILYFIFFTSYSLFLILYSLFFICYSLFLILYFLFFICYSLFLILYSLFFICYSLFLILYSLFFIPYSLSVILYFLFFLPFSLFLSFLFLILFPDLRQMPSANSIHPSQSKVLFMEFLTNNYIKIFCSKLLASQVRQRSYSRLMTIRAYEASFANCRSRH